MSIKALGSYDFPSRSAKENYGDDQLVHVLFADNLWFCSAACFRAPSAMTFADFWSQIVEPFAKGDPDFDGGAPRRWSLHGEPITPTDEDTLTSLGVRHKDVLTLAIG